MVTKITFNIDAEGEVTLSVDGATGKSCEDFTRPFEELLGTVAERVHKDSYFSDVAAHEGTDATLEQN